MTAITLDTYEAVKALQDAGVQESQAKAFVSLVKEGSGVAQDLVTNKDLEEKLKSLEERMNAKFTILEQRMTIRLGLMMFAAAGLSVGIAELLT